MLKKGISELKLMLILDEVDNKSLPKKINRIDILTSSVQITTNLFWKILTLNIPRKTTIYHLLKQNTT